MAVAEGDHRWSVRGEEEGPKTGWSLDDLGMELPLQFQGLPIGQGAEAEEVD